FSDNNTQTWNQGVAFVQDGGGQPDGFAQYYAKNIAGRSAHTVTYTPNASVPCSVAVAEISSADTAAPLDKAASRGATVTESNPHSTGTTAATTQADEIAVAGGTHDGGASETFASNNGYTIQTSQTNTANEPIVLSTKILSATGTQSEAYNLTANNAVL